MLIPPVQRRLAGCVCEGPTKALLKDLLNSTLSCIVISVSSIQTSVASKSTFFSQSVTSPLPSRLVSVSWTVEEESGSASEGIDDLSVYETCVAL